MFELYTFSNGSPYCLIHKTRFCFTKKQIITPYIFLIKFLYGGYKNFFSLCFNFLTVVVKLFHICGKAF